ncbi:hypothetical protein SAMN05216260_103228 [Streptomyces griseoaurantiacus]|uniref:Ca-activated chloride channel family protein n=1 Tax=Streptomyces griseoaurantiacus TaxID=68213 RepID=A0A1G7F5S2_9ACTN|nr:hypothetical protein SAMN05216260_103228 [Streptomyces jietaisiensis]
MRRRTSRGLPGRPPVRRRPLMPVGLCAAMTLALCAAGPYAAAGSSATVLRTRVVDAAPEDAADGSYPYAFGADDEEVEGAADTADAASLDPGGTYRSTLPEGAVLSYRLDLDATANAYVSATAVPRPGARVAAADGLRVSVRDAEGHVCSTGTAHFGPTRSPRPVAAWAGRETGEGGSYLCRGAGTYYALVERRGASGAAGASSSPDDWDLELDYVTEPAARGTGESAPGIWNSAAPAPVSGDPVRRSGGAGFAEARALDQGVWKDAVRPGQTLFYKVPVDWGQQFYATAELQGGTGGDAGFLGTALTMSLYNPARGPVDEAEAGYGGERATAALRPLPPVAHENRYASVDRVGAMRFAGWYYLAVHLGTPVGDRFGAGPYGLTLRIRVSGEARPGPVYTGRSAPSGVFEVGARTRGEAEDGTGNGTDGSGRGAGSRPMKLLAAGGLGTGSLLLLWLGLWTLLSRRRRPARTG